MHKQLSHTPHPMTKQRMQNINWYSVKLSKLYKNKIRTLYTLWENKREQFTDTNKNLDTPKPLKLYISKKTKLHIMWQNQGQNR